MVGIDDSACIALVTECGYRQLGHKCVIGGRSVSRRSGVQQMVETIFTQVAHEKGGLLRRSNWCAIGLWQCQSVRCVVREKMPVVSIGRVRYERLSANAPPRGLDV